MKAAVVHAPGAGFSIEDITVGEPQANEVLVKVKAVGLCLSDLTMASADLGFPMPAVFGHEVAGVVERVGPGVRSLHEGDHVVGALIRYCGDCPRCLSGRSYYCRNTQRTERPAGDPPRLSSDREPVNQAFGLGGFAEKALVHENQLARIPQDLPFEQAALLGCGVITGAGAVLNTAQVGRGESVVIVGTGGVGLNAISSSVLAGASEIVAIDVSDEKLAHARTFGATHTINGSEEDPVTALRQHLPEGADYVFDFVGSQQVAQQGLEMLSYGGGLYLVGIGGKDVPITLDAMTFMRNRNRIESVYMGSANLKVDVPFFAGLASRGLLHLNELVTETIGLDEINEGYQRVRDGKVARLVITMESAMSEPTPILTSPEESLAAHAEQ
ncbi:alcohol dehydrogenase (plasmid) [Citricoccus sp. SGAir0253]|uniref:zinc-binding dehydrogenase n=1 Tax=Citricoccus sp. SGAir0253 TaxID=2567881 RepID=UPI0010CD63F3|nr:zinc-binding dehydrogenase [Citricoccus sp. SGAir0253]QCU79658.1 alcohol dehydrogenase [Citricoccus sp. SGAir0253]